MSKMRFRLIDHICRHCGGRMLEATSGFGPTGGGNPIFICSTCEKGSASTGPDVACWCGFSMRGQQENAYTCLPFSILKEKPYLLQAFRACGCDPESGQKVGVVTWSDLRRLQQTNAQAVERPSCSCNVTKITCPHGNSLYVNSATNREDK